MPAFPRDALAARLRELAAEGVYLGTSSWKYPGWLGMVYDRQRYETRGRFAESRFRRDCLAEYAETFPAVCVDAGYYQFPRPQSVAAMMDQVPEHFRFGFKVTDAVTVLDFPKLDRYGARAGMRNPHFLVPGVFADQFLAPLEPHRAKIGVLILEFAGFIRASLLAVPSSWIGWDGFFEGIPAGWPLGVEVRNRSFLRDEYFSVLRGHGVAHVYNNWTRMPPVSEQLGLPGSRTAEFLAARFLLTPGRTYEKAVEAFSPYTDIAAPDPTARLAAQQLVASARGPVPVRRPSLIFVNNRLEGSSPRTIAAVVGVDG
jgi:uncharacterized protein YecE (DUF72 family)